MSLDRRGLKEVPLIEAVKQCDISEVQRLIGLGADLDAQDEHGKTALIAACHGSDHPETTTQTIALLECLLKAGANLKTKDKFHRDAVYFAVSDGRIDLVMLFQKYSAKILDSISLLTFISHWPRHLFRNKRAGYTQVLQLILNEHPNLESKTNERNPQTALLLACREGLQSVVLALLKAGADANSRDSHGNGALEAAANFAWRANSENLQVIRALIESGADVNNIGKNGCSALYWATYSGGNTISVVNFLLEAGANPNLPSADDACFPLINATRSDREDICLALINAGANVDARNRAGKTALAYAASLNRVAVLKLLIVHRADYNIADYQGLLAFDHARLEGMTDCMQILQVLPAIAEHTTDSWSLLAQSLLSGKNHEIKQCIKQRHGDLNNREKDGRTSLHIAVYYDQIKTVQLLIAAGADVNPSGVHGSPLHAALLKGRTKIACLLINAGASVNVTEDYIGSNGLAPLHLAVKNGDVESTKLLLKAGAQVDQIDSDQCTALYYATKANRLGLVKLLIMAGADVNASDKYQRSSLHICSPHPDSKVAEYLIKKGADINAVYSLAGKYSVLSSAVLNSNNKLVALLIREGVDVNWCEQEESFYRTALNIAATQDSDGKIVEMLIRAGADMACKNFKGASPIHQSIKYGSFETTICLINNGADINAKDEDNNTPLMVSVSANKQQAFKLLMENKADLNKQTKTGMTALHLAAFNGRIEMVRCLLAAGADARLENNTGKRPHHLAKEPFGTYDVIHEEIIALFK